MRRKNMNNLKKLREAKKSIDSILEELLQNPKKK